MNRKTMYWKLAWDTFHLQVFDYDGDVRRIDNWIKKENYTVKNVLEIGCGAGRYLILLEKLGYQCVGVDNDPNILVYAKQFVLSKETKVRLLPGDILKRIPSPLKSKFDLVLGKHLSFSRSDLEKVLDYAKKALAPDSPRLLVFDFLVADKSNLDKEILSIDSAVRNNLFLVRLNQMILREELSKYEWKEVYIIKNARRGFTVSKNSRRSLWFLSHSELENLLKDRGIEIQSESKEPTGINNLEGVTIYGKFKQ